MEKVFLSDVLKAIKKAYIWNDDISQQILEKEMMQLPSAEEIVRCKDCEYFAVGKTTQSYPNPYICLFHSDMHKFERSALPDDYCSWGKTKGDK